MVGFGLSVTLHAVGWGPKAIGIGTRLLRSSVREVTEIQFMTCSFASYMLATSLTRLAAVMTDQ